ncbi:MAG: type II secretion system F family protein [Chloroflexota bacterium]
MTIFIVIGVLVGIAIAGYGAMTVRQLDETMIARLGRYELRTAGSLTDLELQIPRSERLLGPARRSIAVRVRAFTPLGTIEKTQLKLSKAGNPNNFTVQDFLGIKGMASIATSALTLLLLALVFHPSTIKFGLFTVAAVGLGFNLPDLWLSQKIKERRKLIQKFLPDAIDILAISVEAGQGFDGALATLSSRKTNALTYEFDRFRLEVQSGKGRKEAYRDLAMRSDVEDVSQFVAAMIQADQLGIGISQVLKAQSEELRIKRRQRAEEKARQAPIKMLFPLIFLMFPSLFIVILGPAIPQLLSFGGAPK